MKTLIRDVWSDGDEEKYLWALEYLMHIIAHPGEKSGTCLAIRGGQGAGKSIVFEGPMARILGDLQLRVANQNLILGNFNEAVAGKLLITLEEAAFAGDRAVFERMKELATGHTVTINPKNKAPFTIPNFARLVVISNNDHFVNIEADDRRYTVYETTSAWADGNKHREMLDQMQNGGAERFVYEALTHTFRKSDNDRLVINSNLKTEAAVRQFAQSRSPLQRAIAKLLLSGTPLTDDGSVEELWSLAKPWTVPSLKLERLIQHLVEKMDPHAAKRVTLSTIIGELERHVGVLDECRPKGLDPETGKRKQLPTERRFPPRRHALEHARAKGLLTLEEFEQATGCTEGE